MTPKERKTIEAKLAQIDKLTREIEALVKPSVREAARERIVWDRERARLAQARATARHPFTDDLGLNKALGVQMTAVPTPDADCHLKDCITLLKAVRDDTRSVRIELKDYDRAGVRDAKDIARYKARYEKVRP